MKRLVLATCLIAGVVAPAAQAEVGPDYISSDNVTLVERQKLMGDGVGARVAGDYLFVTSTKSLDIFDIKTDPEHPKLVGQETMDVEFENEEVPTNGKILGISGQIGCKDPGSANALNQSGYGTNSGNTQSSLTGCLTLWDVSDPSAPKEITSVSGAGQHTSACLFDCTWMWGSAGAVTDLRDPKNAKIVANWNKDLEFKSGCHHLREIQPGVMLGSCQPIMLLSARAEDGGSPVKPVVLDTGTNADNRFIHSSQWPNNGTDKFMIAGGETNASPTCDDTVGAFMVWDASAVRDGHGGFNKGQQFKLVSEIRPTNGTYADGHSPYNGLGCSVHWFEQHPTFHDGGLVALAEYENGTHFLQITPEGKIVDQGFFLPLAGSTSAPHWNPYNPRIVYSVDYGRGLDVLKYTGDFYVPPAAGAPPATNVTPGTNGTGQFKKAVKKKKKASCARYVKKHHGKVPKRCRKYVAKHKKHHKHHAKKKKHA